MTTTKRTPGPWRIGALESGQAAVDGVGGDVTGWVSIPDAHLIAAAPALLEALENADQQLGGWSGPVDLPKGVLTTIRAAIKLARGEP